MSEWTINTLREHHDVLREVGHKFEVERDRRYAEVATEREKALKIKETADLAALSLAREIQTYKDEKANDLRSQIERERGTYVQQSELKSALAEMGATIKPLAEWVSSQQGRSQGLSAGAGFLITAGGLAVAIIGVIIGTRG